MFLHRWKELWKFFRNHAFYCLLFAFLLTVFTADLIPRYYSNIKIVATGNELKKKETGSVAWLTQPAIKDLRNTQIEIWNSKGWEVQNGIFISSRNQPAELRLKGYFPLNRNVEFIRTPYSGEVVVSFNDVAPRRIHLSNGSGIESLSLLNYLPRNRYFFVPTLLRFVTKLFQNLILLLLLFFISKNFYAEFNLNLISSEMDRKSQIQPNLRFRTILFAFLFVLVVNLFFLIVAHPPLNLLQTGAFYVQNILGQAHIVVNSDSWELLYTARQPNSLLESDHTMYLDRPIYAGLGFLLSIPLRGFRSFFVNNIGGSLSNYVPEFSGLVLLNAFILTVAILVLLYLMKAPMKLWSAMLLPFMILCGNEVTKVFFWTPHLQILNICVPIFSIALYDWLLKSIPSLRLKHFVFLGFTLGFSLLLYGAFVISIGGVFLIFFFYAKRWKIALLFLILSALPTLAWMSFVIYRTGSYHPGAVAIGREFVWFLDSLNQGGINQMQLKLSENLWVFGRTFLQVMTFPGIVLASCLVARAITRIKLTNNEVKSLNNLRLACLFHFLVALPFFAFMGFYAQRLTWSFVPIVVILLAAELKILSRSFSGKVRVGFEMIVVMVSVAYLGYWIARPGPWG